VRLQPVPLGEVFDHILRHLAGRIQETGATLDLPPDWPVARGNATLLTQVFTNLLDNALTFRRPGVAPHISVACRAEPGYDVVRVTDNGIGIPAEHHEKIFNVFQRLHSDDEYPGTGIGLANVKKAAGLLGGQVGVESVPGQGSTFWVKLPVSRERALGLVEAIHRQSKTSRPSGLGARSMTHCRACGMNRFRRWRASARPAGWPARSAARSAATFARTYDQPRPHPAR
jgi:K+-sensing histidine kinase KdpD